MFRLNLKIAFRNLWKNKGYTLINILGLSIGMASCILIYIYIHYQVNFDQDFKNSDRIYRFVSNWNYNNFNDYSQGSPIPLAQAAKNEMRDLQKIATIARDWGLITIKDDKGKQLMRSDEKVYYTSPEFFDIFSIPWVSKTHALGLKDPNTVVLSESMAKKFFGDADKALGKSMLYRNETYLKVVGVFKDRPENTSFPINIVISFESFYAKNNKDWDSVDSGRETWILVNEGITQKDLNYPLEVFNKKHFRQTQISGNQTSILQPLNDIHFNEKYGTFYEGSVTKKEIYVLATIGLFLIITACINFVNLATAQAVNRSKEIGVRKVMGSQRRQIIVQFLSETIVIATIALLVACITAELLIPEMQRLLEVQHAFSLFGQPAIFIFMIIMVLFVGIIAGLYPAMIVSGFRPALAIKNRVNVNTGSLSLRKILIVLQFSVTIILVISTLVIIRQMEYVRNKPLGFNAEAVFLANVPQDSLGRARQNNFREKILHIPGVKMLSYCAQAPFSSRNNTTNFFLNETENKDFEVKLTPIDDKYFNLFGISLIAGKTFIKSDTLNGYIVNETFLKKTGFTDPQQIIGKVLREGRNKAQIIGVVKDFNDRSLKQTISPIAMYQGANRYGIAAIKIDSDHLIEARKQIETIWNNTYPEGIFFGQFLDHNIQSFYKSEQTMGTLFRFFAGVIIFISFIGLFGLISFVANQRTKELAIRRVLGASTLQVMQLLNSSFLIMVFIANLIAWPLAYVMVKKWLSGFAYQMELSIWPFVLSMLLSIILTLVIVSLRSYRAAVANTVDALKYE